MLVKCLVYVGQQTDRPVLVFHKTNVVYDIVVHVHKNRFYLCIAGNHFELEGQK